jgi:hypothetical protein
VTARYPIGRRVATGEAMPTAAEMNELLAERDALAAEVDQWKALGDVTVSVRLVSGPGDLPERLEVVWLGWLTKARERSTAAAQAAAADRPTPTPATPNCPIHPDMPTGSKACPRCTAEATPAPDLRALRRATTQEAS